MDGFVADYISTFTGKIGRQPTDDEYAQIMTGFTPDRVPVLRGIAAEARRWAGSQGEAAPSRPDRGQKATIAESWVCSSATSS